MEPEKKLRILLVDDHVLFLEAMKNFLLIHGMEIVGMAKNGAEALLKYEMTRPDIVLMDLQMDHFDGLETTRQLKKEFPEAVVIMLTACEEEDSLRQAIKAGAVGYLIKSMEADKFLAELARCLTGKLPLALGMASHWKKDAVTEKKTTVPLQDEVQISERQTMIIRLIVQGKPYKEIAQQLNLKEVTVKYHVKEIIGKLELDNRSELIAFALRRGIV